MNLKFFVPLAIPLILSCSDEGTSQQKDFPRSNTFVQWSKVAIVGQLDARLSIIAPANTEMLVLLGTAEPFALGLTVADQKVLKNGRYYIESEKYLRFSAGEKLENFRADLIDYSSKTAVGTLVFNNPASNFPNQPYQVEELCTGPFEKTCTLSYDEDSKVFKIDLHTVTPQPTE
jgi:hypothetical protein